MDQARAQKRLERDDMHRVSGLDGREPSAPLEFIALPDDKPVKDVRREQPVG